MAQYKPNFCLLVACNIVLHNNRWTWTWQPGPTGKLANWQISFQPSSQLTDSTQRCLCQSSAARIGQD